jgi:rubrerythrin
MDKIVRGLLRAALWLKSYTCFHAKIFLRTDQFERTVTNFPDASKLLATRAELSWARYDLHGLLWQRLINAEDKHGERLRQIYNSVVGKAPNHLEEIWFLHEEAKRETPTQKKLFEKLAGLWMGRDPRRGVPYTWSVGHLADGHGQTSPRSFLAAIRQAASDSKERYPEHNQALHYESIKRGVRKASEIRVNEISEDYPWVKDVLSLLKGLTVPCDYSSVLMRWEDKFPEGPGGISFDRLPPQHVERGWEGIREDLERLGLIEKKRDGRIDMPDLYRVGFGLGRKGGVKPKE